ncbi:hypothetical protein BpHYR1_016534 [Brachionus plicatilis]|uniref:Uncharacterized protein n=1 Tax=Brachionus plicatilis TaxID=10195 RepID=A0A3M7R8C0_BRAPC|nr:hypothetical protein BpHYR1_016534 [Brachionus plicatilis]
MGQLFIGKTFDHFDNFEKMRGLINSFVIIRSMLKFATFKLSIYNNINLIFIDFSLINTLLSKIKYVL